MFTKICTKNPDIVQFSCHAGLCQLLDLRILRKNLLMLVVGTWVLQVGQLGKLAICARVAKAARWPNLQITKNKLMNDLILKSGYYQEDFFPD